MPSKTIKAVRLHYCFETLQNNEPYKVNKELIKLKNDLHEKRMTETGCEVCISNEDFKDNISNSKQNKPRHMTAGQEYQNVILKLCKRIIEDKDIPRSSNLLPLPLHMLWKMKGVENILGNKKFLHIKLWLPRKCKA